jgi:hypothetical protein
MIDRESVIERSIDVYLRQQLFAARGYPQDKVEILDAYPTNDRMSAPLDKNYIAIGWSTDDGGRQAELGTAFKRRIYTFDFYVFGTNRVWGKNLASVIRFSLESDQVINLLDPRDGETVIDHVDVDYVSTQQAVTRTPRPWEENCWITRLRVEDYYDSSSGG